MDAPLFPAPPGYVVDVENPQRSGVAVNFAVGIVGMVIAGIFMGIRMYTKLALAKNFSLDDGALVGAWLFSMAIQIIVIFQYGRGTLGVHVWELTGSRLKSSLVLVQVVSILYCAHLACAKLSLLFFYLRLSPVHWFRLSIFTSMFLVMGSNLALLFPLIFACTPFRKTWDVTVVEGSCIDRTRVYMATAILNMVTDILLLVLPIPMVANLQMPRKQKAIVMCIFGIGATTCITSGVRLALLFPMLKTIDQTWEIVMPGLWCLIEANLVVITASLPAMRLFVRHVAPQLLGDSSTRNRSRKQDGGYANGAQLSKIQTIGSRGIKIVVDRSAIDRKSLDSYDGSAAEWHADADSERKLVSPTKCGEILRTETITSRSDVLDTEEHDRTSWRHAF